MTHPTDLRDLVAARLVAGVPAVAGRVHVERRAFPMQSAGQGGAAQFPAILVYEEQILRTGNAGNQGPPSFDTKLTLRIIAGVEMRTEAMTKTTLDALSGAIEEAILGHPDVPGAVSAISRWVQTRGAQGEGERIIGTLAIEMDLEFEEVFPPAIEDALETVHMTMDAIDPADPTGDYGPIDDFPAPEDPPREQGPDGRAELETRIDLT